MLPISRTDSKITSFRPCRLVYSPLRPLFLFDDRPRQPAWIEKSWSKALYGIALRPHLILYLRASVPSLVQRLIHGRGLNYWEAGMDLNLADNLYDSFVIYQTQIIQELEKLALEYNFVGIDADRAPREIFEDLQRPIRLLLQNRLTKSERPF